VDGWLRCLGGAVGFGFAAVWITASLAAALVCVLSAAVGYGAVLMAERTRAKLSAHAGRPTIPTPSTLPLPSRTTEVEDLPLQAEELNHDLGHVYEPTAGRPPLAGEAEYGWPLRDDTATSSETP
jgi:hypothetical protein